MRKELRQYRVVPPKGFSLDDDDNISSDVKPPSGFVLDNATPKKKETSSVASNVSLPNTTSSLGGEKSQNVYDPVRDALNPHRQQLQQAQSAFDPLRNRAVSDQTRNNVLPVDVRNKQFEQSDFGVKQTNEKVANANLQQAHSEVKRHLSNVSTAKKVLEDIKQKHGGVIPADNETAQIVKPVSDSFDAANKDNILVKSVADSKDVKDFVAKHSGAIIPNQSALAAKTWEMINDPNVEEAFRRNPEKWKDFIKTKSDFNNSFPDVAKQRIASQVAQWREDAKQNSPIYNDPSKSNLDKLVESKFKKGDMNASDRAFYYQHVKPADIPTTGFFNEVGRNYEQSTRNSFLGRALANVGLMENPKDKYEFAPQVNPTVNEIAGGGGALVGQLAPIVLSNVALKGAGFSDKAANIISVVNQFGPTNQDRAEKLFPKDPASKWAYTIAGAFIDAMITEVPILKGKSGILKAEAENLSKVLGNDAINSSAKEQAKKAFINRIEGFIGATAKNTTHTAGVLSSIGTAHQLLDVAANAPNAVKNLEHTDFVGEFIKNAKSALIVGGAQAAGKLIPEAKTETELSQSINELPESPYTSPLKEAIKSGDETKLQTYLKEISEQVSNPQSAEVTRKLFGDKLSDIATKLYPDAKSEPINIRNEENTPITEQGVGDKLDNGIEVDNSRGGEGVGDKTVGETELRKQFEENDTPTQHILTLKELPRFDGVSLEIGGSTVGTGKKGVKEKPNDLDVVYKVDNDVYFDTEHPFWEQADALAQQDGIDVIVVSPMEVSKLEGGKGKWIDRLFPLDNDAKNTIKKSVPIDQVDRYNLLKKPTNEIPITSKEESTPIKEPNTNIGEAEEGTQPAESKSEQPSIPESNKGNPPAEPPAIGEPPKGSRIFVQHPETELSHRGLQVVANEFSLPDVKTRDRKTDIQLHKDAEATMNDWMDKGQYSKNVEGLVEKAEGGEILTDKERVILEQHLANLSGELRELNKSTPEFDAKLSEIKRLKDAGEKTRSEAGAALRLPTFGSTEKDLSDYYIRELDVNNGAPLTETQKETVEKEFNNISEIEKSYQDKIASLQAENSKLKADQEVKKTKASTPKNTKKTHEDYVKERQSSIDKAKEALKKIRTGESGLSAVPILGVRELIAIAPHVKDAMKSYVLEGIDKLDDLVKKLHGDFKDVIEDLTEKNIHDIIAGEYNEKKKTRNELSEQLFNLRTEAQLVTKLNDLLKGEVPKSETRKIKRNQAIEELRKKIKSIKEFDKDVARANDLEAKMLDKEAAFRTPEEKALATLKAKTLKQIEAIEKQIKSGDFSPPEKKPQIKLDKETVTLKDKLVKLKQEREIRIMKIQYANRSRFEKARDATLEILNVPRTLMSSMDYSAPLRQGIIASISHPRTSGLAAIEMFRQSVSQKRFDRWFFDLKNDPRYEIMAKSGLSVSDPHDYRLSAKEEAFMNNLAEKIPIVGKFIKGSERAYVGYLNKMRVDLFNRFAERYEEQGKTIENSPQLYKALGEYINNQTGRGGLGKLENYAPILNTVFFSPRLIASRLNLLNPVYYYKLPKELRIMAAKDMLKFAGLGITVLALAKLNGAQVEDDPRSSDFGKIKVGDTRWDIWGGFQQYIRLFAQMATGQKKSAMSQEVQSLEGDGRFGETRGSVLERFARGKLAPVPSMGVDFLSGRTTVGEKTDAGDEAISHLLPLLYSDIKEAMKDKGISSLFTVGLPATFGVSVQTFSPNKPTSKSSGGAGASGSYKKPSNKQSKKSSKKTNST